MSMKKITILTILLFVLSSVSAFAAYSNGTSGDGVVTLGSTVTLVVKLSSKVSIDYDAETAGLAYAIATYHSSGVRTYGSSSGDAKIYYQDATAVAAPTAPTTADGTADFSGDWTAL